MAAEVVSQSYLDAKREEIERTLALAPHEAEIAKLEARIAAIDPDDVCRLAERLSLRSELEDRREELHRTVKKRELLDKLVVDVGESARINNLAYERQLRKRRRAAVDDGELSDGKRQRFYANTVLRDVALYHDGEELHSTRLMMMDDTCINCNDGTQMERNIYTSCLVCPVCKHQRYYVDTSVAAPGTWSKKASDTTRHTPKCLVHYTSFLQMCQALTSKQFDEAQYDQLSYDCWVAGARKSTDITKNMIHDSQRWHSENNKPAYSESLLLHVQMRGHVKRFPPRLTRKLLYLFSRVWPAFTVYKTELETSGTRVNMAAFKFITIILLILTGHEVYTDVISNFKMYESRIKHTLFIRKIFKIIGIKWENLRFVDISDEELDWFEAEQEVERRANRVAAAASTTSKKKKASKKRRG